MLLVVTEAKESGYTAPPAEGKKKNEPRTDGRDGGDGSSKSSTIEIAVLFCRCTPTVTRVVLLLDLEH